MKIDYKPGYDTTIRTTTRGEQHTTVHLEHIDWEYPFNDTAHTASMCCSAERKQEIIDGHKDWLRIIERCHREGKECSASNYGGWPRIWHRVICLVMASAWPYWSPRPTVIVEGPLGGVEYFDWMSLTGVKEGT